jgi:hypothetical protein
MVQLLPHASGLPGPQPPSAGDSAAAAQRPGGQQPPGRAGAQDIDQAAKDRPVRDPGAAAVGLGWWAGSSGAIASQMSSGTAARPWGQAWAWASSAKPLTPTSSL